MNRESEMHFSDIPSVDIKRSRFKIDYDHKFTCNSGKLIPFYMDADILPGDTVSMDVSSVVRMATPLYPTMDNAFMDVYFFSVPYRLLWEHFKEFWGENNTTYWEQPVEYEIPQIVPPSGGWAANTIADYMGLPTYENFKSISHIPFRAYCKIWNDWFRDENLKDPAFFNEDETTLTGTNSGTYVTNAQLGAEPLPVAKIHDRYTSALPAAQKGPSIGLPLGTEAIVKTSATDADITGWEAMHVGGTGTGLPWGSTGIFYPLGIGASGDEYALTHGAGIANGGTNEGAPTNLIADLSTATAATISELRQAYAIQRYFETIARSGSRYIEWVKGVFGVTSPDARQQRSEYLGGMRSPINITQVLQTSSTDATSPQGNTAAYSFTPNSDSIFTKSFTEHTVLMGLMCIRTEKTYQQGIERQWSRKKWTDFYLPQFAALSEQAILNKEIYAKGTAADDEAFGYQEAWSEYRYKNSQISGAFRSNYPGGSLDSWHYAEYYTSQPILSSGWIDEDNSVIARTLAVQNEPQFLCDFYCKGIYVRPMPVYSVPGLSERY